jgi:hypothetical protein
VIQALDLLAALGDRLTAHCGTAGILRGTAGILRDQAPRPWLAGLVWMPSRLYRERAEMGGARTAVISPAWQICRVGRAWA